MAVHKTSQSVLVVQPCCHVGNAAEEVQIGWDTCRQANQAGALATAFKSGATPNYSRASLRGNMTYNVSFSAARALTRSNGRIADAAARAESRWPRWRPALGTSPQAGRPWRIHQLHRKVGEFPVHRHV